MKARLIAYPLIILITGIFFAFGYYPPLRHSIFVSRMLGEELRPPVTSGEGSPIQYAVLDMNGDGITATPLGNSSALFDHVGNGIRFATTWISAKDGFIALDLNNNGIVDDGTELIGNHFRSSSADKAENSFEALSFMDDNHDDVIDAKDPSYSRLMLWQDMNSDGICQTTEMKSLKNAGITSINTKQSAQRTQGSKTLGAGNFELNTPAAALSSEFLDLGFEVNTFKREFIKEIRVSIEARKSPNMRGSGLVRDMHEAATLLPEFANKLGEYSAVISRKEQLQLLDGLISSWGNSSGFSDMQTRAAQHGYQLTTNLDPVTLAHLNTLEQFNGRGYAAMPWEEHIGSAARQGLIIGWDGDSKHLKLQLYPVQLTPLANAYKTLRDSVYKALLHQTRLRPYYEAILTVTHEDSYAYDLSPARRIFETRFKQYPEETIIDLIEFNAINRETWKDALWSNTSEQLLYQMLSEISPSPALLTTLKEFSINIPPKEAKATVSPAPQIDAASMPANEPRHKRIKRKPTDLRYCLELKDNNKIIRCTEMAQ